MEIWSRKTLRVVTARVFYIIRGSLISPFIFNNSVEMAAPFKVVSHPRVLHTYTFMCTSTHRNICILVCCPLQGDNDTALVLMEDCVISMFDCDDAKPNECDPNNLYRQVIVIL